MNRPLEITVTPDVYQRMVEAGTWLRASFADEQTGRYSIANAVQNDNGTFTVTLVPQLP